MYNESRVTGNCYIGFSMELLSISFSSGMDRNSSYLKITYVNGIGKMETVKSTKKKILKATESEQKVKGTSGKIDQFDAYSALERAVQLALNTYANVHRGSGHNSMVSTHLYEKARVIVLEYLALNKNKYVVIFCTRKSLAVIKAQIAPGSYKSISSEDIGLSLGVWALAVNKKALPHGAPLFSG